MKALKPIVLLLVVFGAGVVCGIVGTRAVIRHDVRVALREPDAVWARLEKKLGKDLDLSREQRMKAVEIVSNARRDFQQLRFENSPRYRAIMKKVHTDLAVILTPDQLARLEKLRTERPLLRLIDDPGDVPQKNITP